MEIKVTDWITDFFIKKNIRHVFGYPGGMVIHLMDSLSKRKNEIEVITNYHEQAAAFAACGYAMTSGNVGVAFATSGPGFTNLITGISNAYYDSIPLILITGNVNTYESSEGMKIKQRGFQEMNVIEVAKNFTKYSVYINNPDKIPEEFEKAYEIAISGRKGPVLIDLPMDVSRSFILNRKSELLDNCERVDVLKESDLQIVFDELLKSERPVLLLGAGCKDIPKLKFKQLVSHLGIPVVTSMIAVDFLDSENEFNFGFIGAYGHRYSNFVTAKSDLIISIGSRMDIRQVGGQRDKFAKDAKIIRFDIDKDELSYLVKKNEIGIECSAQTIIDCLVAHKIDFDFSNWHKTCKRIKRKLESIDENYPNRIIDAIMKNLPKESIITTDVGQNQVWVAQSKKIDSSFSILFSASFGSMGVSLPSAIGAFYGSNAKPVISFNGDGGIQMNIQELQVINREKMPIKIIVINNYSLGMIRHFQEMYMKGNYAQTISENGYTVPDFESLANTYDLKYTVVSSVEDVNNIDFSSNYAEFIEVLIPENTYVIPKSVMNHEPQDQSPFMDEKLYKELMEL